MPTATTAWNRTQLPGGISDMDGKETALQPITSFLWDYFCGEDLQTLLRRPNGLERLARYCVAAYDFKTGEQWFALGCRKDVGVRDTEQQTVWAQVGRKNEGRLTFIGGRLAVVVPHPSSDDPRLEVGRDELHPPHRVVYLNEVLREAEKGDLNAVFKRTGDVFPDFIIDEVFYYVVSRIDSAINELLAKRLIESGLFRSVNAGKADYSAIIGRILEKMETKSAEGNYGRYENGVIKSGEARLTLQHAMVALRAIKTGREGVIKEAVRFLVEGTTIETITDKAENLIMNFMKKHDLRMRQTPDVLYAPRKYGAVGVRVGRAWLLNAYLGMMGFSSSLSINFGKEGYKRSIILVQKPQLQAAEMVELAKEILDETCLNAVTIGDVSILPQALLEGENKEGEIYFIIRGEDMEFGRNFVNALLTLYDGKIPAYIRLVERRSLKSDEEDLFTDDEYMKMMEDMLVNEINNYRNKYIQ